MLKGLFSQGYGDENSSLRPAQIMGRRVDSEASAHEERQARREVMARQAESRHEAHHKRGLGDKGIAALAAADREKRRAREEAAGLNLFEADKASHSDGSGASTASEPSRAASSSSSSQPRSLVTVIRSGLWSEDGEEDMWQVDVPRSASTLQVKQQIFELFGVPVEEQRLQCTPDVDDECLDDEAIVDRVVSGVPLFLLPQSTAGGSSRRKELQAERQAIQAERQALQESLREVSYQLRVLRPEVVGGYAAGKSTTLRLGALMPAGDAQAIAEAELLGLAAGTEPAFLTFAGRFLPPDMPLHFAGVSDGDTLILAAQPIEDDEAYPCDDSDSDSDSFDAAMQRWA